MCCLLIFWGIYIKKYPNVLEILYLCIAGYPKDRKYMTINANLLCWCIIGMGLLNGGSAWVWGQDVAPAVEYRVVLDAGHGGRDPGAVWRGVREKDINLDVVRRIGRHLREVLPSAQIYYTRTDDRYLGLQQRAQIANAHQAHLFVSVHCNNFPRKPHRRGMEVYVLGVDKMDAQYEIVQRENGEVPNVGEESTDAEGMHIISAAVVQRNFESSLDLASCIARYCVDFQRMGRPRVLQAGFVVLYRTAVPAVLIELGYLSNEVDFALLNSASGREALAKKIAEGIVHYLQSSVTVVPLTHAGMSNTRSAGE